MRICLASPLSIALSPREAVGIPFADAPLGILTLAAVARSAGHTVELVDFDYMSHMVRPERFVAQVSERIAATGCDVAGFGTICDSYPLTLRVAREVKQ